MRRPLHLIGLRRAHCVDRADFAGYRSNSERLVMRANTETDGIRSLCYIRITVLYTPEPSNNNLRDTASRPAIPVPGTLRLTSPPVFV